MKTVFISSLYFVFLFVLICCDNGVSCYTSGKFIIQDIHTSPFVHGTMTSYGGYVQPLRSDSTTLETHERLGYTIYFEDSSYDFTNTNKSRGLMYNQAFATDPCYTEYKFMDSFESIKFITISDFDSIHHAGSDITGYFSYSTGSHTNELDSINGLVHYLNSRFYGDGVGQLLVILREKPHIPKELLFKIQIKFTSGREASVNTPSVVLTE